MSRGSRSQHRTDAQRAAHAVYMKRYMKEQKAKEARLVAVARKAPKMKYAHLLEERVCEGKSYAEYRAEGKKKVDPLRKERMRLARIARADRIKKFGKIPKLKPARGVF